MPFIDLSHKPILKYPKSEQLDYTSEDHWTLNMACGGSLTQITMANDEKILELVISPSLKYWHKAFISEVKNPFKLQSYRKIATSKNRHLINFNAEKTGKRRHLLQG